MFDKASFFVPPFLEKTHLNTISGYGPVDYATISSSILPLSEFCIKHFMPTNCQYGITRLNSKQNTKKRNLDTSKESFYLSDSKCMGFIQFTDTHQNLRAWENLYVF